MNRNHKKEQLTKIAKDTISVLEKGFYLNRQGKKMIIEEELKDSVSQTILYTPKMGDELLSSLSVHGKLDTLIEVTNESTLQAAKRLKDEGFEKVMALNFASAKHPGGGFLRGSSAQEESLARSSGLYASISKQTEMYDYHEKKLRTCLYSDYMIYSPNVPVFRHDNGSFLDQPFLLSFITSPAINKGVVMERERNVSNKMIHDTMKKRIEKILAIGIEKGYESIVLGAFGCGVFKNNPNDVAGYFKEALSNNELLKNHYKKVVFAVLDFSPSKETFHTFKQILKP